MVNDDNKEEWTKDIKALCYIIEGVSATSFKDLPIKIRDLASGKPRTWKVLAETFVDKGITKKVLIIKI